MSDAAAIAEPPPAEPPPGRGAASAARPPETTERGDDEAASPQQDAPVLFLNAIERYYRQGESVIEILKGAELAVWPGQSVALVAPSGAGKSTLLHVAGLLEYPDAGEVFIGGLATSTLSDGQRSRLRRTEVGFVYQFHHLLPEFSALENVILPQMIRGLSRKEAATRGTELLNYLGLKERLTHRPAELSGGEQQRVAIARAVANAPRILLADEPTGNLDPRTSERVFSALTQLVRASGLAMICATHNMDIAARMNRRVTLRDGAVVELE
jgi:lipoprotein-releasing system ATP-binding protein